LSALVLITKYKEIPISINKKVHTGPKSQDGGLKKGLFRLRYQVETELCVKKEPKAPANRLIPNENRTNVILSFILIL
jgi:hypothetical protein